MSHAESCVDDSEIGTTGLAPFSSGRRDWIDSRSIVAVEFALLAAGVPIDPHAREGRIIVGEANAVVDAYRHPELGEEGGLEVLDEHLSVRAEAWHGESPVWPGCVGLQRPGPDENPWMRQGR